MFVTSSLQFGFKPDFSADLCTGLLKNVIHTYNMVNDSQVYECFLDASKAFNRVDHVFLFKSYFIETFLQLLSDFYFPGTPLNG